MVSLTFSFPLCVFVIFECTHVHVCLWVAGCTRMCAYIHVGTRSQCQASSFTSFHFVCFRIGLSLNLELTNPARQWASKPQGFPLTVRPPQSWDYRCTLPYPQSKFRSSYSRSEHVGNWLISPAPYVAPWTSHYCSWRQIVFIFITLCLQKLGSKKMSFLARGATA